MKRLVFFATLMGGLLVGASVQAAPPASAAAARARLETPLLSEFLSLLAIPNVAADRDSMRRNAEFLLKSLSHRGLRPTLLTDPQEPSAPPLIFAEWRAPNAKRTLVVYAHYDGQPVNPAEWTTPPFSPTLRTGRADRGGKVITLDNRAAVMPETRLYARGAGDDKGGVMVLLGALDVLRALGRHPTDNLKIVFEGEEEAGSPHLNHILTANKQLLGADLWVICDGPMHPSGRPLITYGARGDFNADLTIYGPNHPLHSGHYGNWAPNPAMRLARLLASMKDDQGRVTVEGWYDGIAPLGERERRAIAEAAALDDPIRQDLGFAVPEAGLSLSASATIPSLNINGLRAANVGTQSANVIPDTASAVLDVRLVLGENPRIQFEKLVEHIRRQGYEVLDHAPTGEERLSHPLIATFTLRPGLYAAARTPMDDPMSRAVADAVRRASDQPIIELPTSGASLPLSIIFESLGARAILVSVANNDDNQHAADENLRLGNLWNGIDLYVALMTHSEVR